MVVIGKTNRLKVLRGDDEVLVLDGEGLGELTLSIDELPKRYRTASKIEVFVYPDRGEALRVTAKQPMAEVGEFALLRVVKLNPYGAFLDWGIDRDLLVTCNNQLHEMHQGREYIVYLYLDNEVNQITATAKIDHHIDQRPPPYFEGEKVELLIANRTDIGTRAIINNAHWGMLYNDEVFEKLHYGQKSVGYIKKIREDNKIDLYLHKPGHGEMDALAQKILDYINICGGAITITDKSPPEVIANRFGVSKKRFKMAVGSLYKKRLITLEKGAIRLAK